MKKRNVLAFMLSLLMLCLTFSSSSCSSYSGVKHDMDDYVLSLEYSSDFKILQLTDIHIGDKDNRKLHYDFMKLTVDDADPDMIVLSGDLFTFASKSTANELFEFIDSFSVPWTAVFGNHDEQCLFSIDWLTGRLNELSESKDSYCIFRDNQDDDIFGNCNFAINLTSGGRIQEQLIFIDSNRYCYGPEYIGYDYIKENQIEWYKSLIDYTTEANGGLTSSVAFFHIPLPEFDTAYDILAAKNPDADYLYDDGSEAKDIDESLYGEVEYLYGKKREKSCPPKYNSGMFDAMLSKGSTKAVIVGHDHMNDIAIRYKGIDLCYGVNSTDRIYFEKGVMGGNLITIHDDHTRSYRQIYHDYSEVKEA